MKKMIIFVFIFLFNLVNIEFAVAEIAKIDSKEENVAKKEENISQNQENIDEYNIRVSVSPVNIRNIKNVKNNNRLINEIKKKIDTNNMVGLKHQRKIIYYKNQSDNTIEEISKDNQNIYKKQSDSTSDLLETLRDKRSGVMIGRDSKGDKKKMIIEDINKFKVNPIFFISRTDMYGYLAGMAIDLSYLHGSKATVLMDPDDVQETDIYKRKLYIDTFLTLEGSYTFVEQDAFHKESSQIDFNIAEAIKKEKDFSYKMGVSIYERYSFSALVGVSFNFAVNQIAMKVPFRSSIYFVTSLRYITKKYADYSTEHLWYDSDNYFINRTSSELHITENNYFNLQFGFGFRFCLKRIFFDIRALFSSIGDYSFDIKPVAVAHYKDGTTKTVNLLEATKNMKHISYTTLHAEKSYTDVSVKFLFGLFLF